MDTWIERRKQRRETVEIEATVVHDAGLARWSATILDITKLGAMLELAADTALPPTFHLLFAHTIQPCQTVWAKGRYVGVSFLRQL